jgi:hypothetical protein
MNIHWQILPHIVAEIEQARDFQEVVGIWHRDLPYLHDCKLIYSQREEADFVALSKDWPRDFPEGGYLRPLFAHDNLCFLDRRIAEEQRLHVESPLNIDSTVEFDTNVASYVEAFVEGRQGARAERVKDMLDFVIRDEQVNFGYNFYVLENAQGYYDGSNVSSIWRNLRALMKLDCLDEERYLETGEVRAVLTERELDERTDEKLRQLYAEPYPTVLAAKHQPENEKVYLVLLKTVEIEHRAKRRSLERKVAELYEFMHYELKTLLVREAIIALHYFKNRSELAFFGKIQPKPMTKSRELLKELKSMSWDLMLFRVMERIATVGGVGDFMIPFFLSFDRKMVQLFDLFPLQGLLFNDQSGLKIPLWETPPIEALAKEIDIRVVEDYFGHTCSNIRQAERRIVPRPDFSELKRALEAEVVRLLTY